MSFQYASVVFSRLACPAPLRRCPPDTLVFLQLLLTEHQREARKAARTRDAANTGLSYTRLDEPESRMVGMESEMLLFPSDSRTSDNSNWPKTI